MIMLFALTTSCTKEEQNPFFTEWKTPFGTPPFNEIENEDYLPAFKEGIRLQQEEIAAITANKEAPTFANTIDALERSGKLLDKVSGVFYNLNSALTSDTMQQIAKEVSPLLSKHHDDINLNAALFARIKSVYEQKSKLNLTVEQNTLLEKYYKDFVRGGANLNDADKEKLRKTNKELSLLSLKFGENVLKENNRFEMVLENKEDLSGLPRNVIAAAAEAAKERGYEGKWVFTLHKPSLIPFIQYSDKRELREKMFKGYITRGDHNDELDNKEIIRKMVNLRIEKAQLLGYKSHADFVLEENMAKTPENVYKLLDKIWDPALAMAKREAAELQKIIYKSGGNFKLMPWDWWYYAEKLRKEKYELDEEVLRPYFKLENVRDGAFEVAHKLYGITFSERNDIPVYHKDVKVFELKEANGKHIGILYTDYFPRVSKRGGAWMEAYSKESNMDGK
jgi:peptidyl-dipeptidase Dcp